MKITYDDKVSLTTSALPRANKCTDDDLNEIKTVVNANADLLNVVMPIGTIVTFAGNTAPTNWLICDGSAISRTTYSDLFNVLGTTYGNGDGSSTFNLPDLRTRVAVGKDIRDSEFETLGISGGEKEVKLIPQNYAHTSWQAELLNPDIDEMKVDTMFTPSGDLYGLHTRYGENNNVPHNNLQPYLVLNYIIKAVKEE